MRNYFLNRLLLFIPTLLIITFLTFIISINAPGDPVALMMNLEGSSNIPSPENLKQRQLEIKHQLGLDLPIFYFSLSNACLPDTFYKIHKEDQPWIRKLAYKYGNWKEVSRFSETIITFEKDHLLKSEDLDLLKNNSAEFIDNVTKYENKLSAKKIIELKNNYNHLNQNSNSLSKFLFSFHWYGLKSQFHRWLFGTEKWFTSTINTGNEGILRGDFGISFQDQRPVSSVLWDALKWTLILSSLSIIISFLVAIPLGMYAAKNHNTKKEKMLSFTLFTLYSLPNFWLASMLITFLCNAEFFDLFPAFGLGELPDTAPVFQRILETFYHMLLPLFCLTYTSLAYISRQMKSSALNTLTFEFIRTARAKGLSEKIIIWKHVFKNALLPIITLASGVFPMLIAGSFVIEIIFSIPGMGKLALEAIFTKNYPVVLAVVLLGGTLTLFGNFISDILYAVVDPRISFSNKNK